MKRSFIQIEMLAIIVLFASISLLRDQAMSTVRKRLEREGLQITDRAALRLIIDIGRGYDHETLTRSRPNSILLASAKILDVSNNVLWRSVSDIDRNATGQPVLAVDEKRKQWEHVLGWLEKDIDPSAIYELAYYRGVGESLLTSDGEKAIERQP